MKFLLYIDILGFSEMVKEDSIKIERIYQIVNELNVHKHHAFKAIIFSDTILIYNIDGGQNDDDKKYLVMYLCEFVQDLLYRLIDENVYYRAIIVHDEFNHYNLENVECFYGNGLIKAYNKEKDIAGMGLFIDNYSNAYNEIFETKQYDSDYSFVYLNQQLEHFKEFYSLDFSYARYLYEEGLIYRLRDDIRYFGHIYNEMKKHPSPKVRSKYLDIWEQYRYRYKEFMDEIERRNFIIDEFEEFFKKE